MQRQAGYIAIIVPVNIGHSKYKCLHTLCPSFVTMLSAKISICIVIGLLVQSIDMRFANHRISCSSPWLMNLGEESGHKHFEPLVLLIVKTALFPWVSVCPCAWQYLNISIRSASTQLPYRQFGQLQLHFLHRNSPIFPGSSLIFIILSSSRSLQKHVPNVLLALCCEGNVWIEPARAVEILCWWTCSVSYLTRSVEA